MSQSRDFYFISFRVFHRVCNIYNSNMKLNVKNISFHFVWHCISKCAQLSNIFKNIELPKWSLKLQLFGQCFKIRKVIVNPVSKQSLIYFSMGCDLIDMSNWKMIWSWVSVFVKPFFVDYISISPLIKNTKAIRNSKLNQSVIFCLPINKNLHCIAVKSIDVEEEILLDICKH